MKFKCWRCGEKRTSFVDTYCKKCEREHTHWIEVMVIIIGQCAMVTCIIALLDTFVRVAG
jgi:hypothetical protein